MSQFNISPDEVAKLEDKFEIKSNERKLKNFLKKLTFVALVTMSIYHFYASGFGTIRDILHRGIHISFCLLYTSPSPRDQRGSRMPSSA